MIAVVRNAAETDILWIARRLRQADQDEIEAGCGKTALEVLTVGLTCSCICRTIEFAGAPAVMFGVYGKIGEPANVWLLGTDEIQNFKKTFLRILDEHVARFVCAFAFLYNFIDVRNHAALSWARKTGATIFEPEPYGVFGLPFRRFEIRRKEPCASQPPSC